MANVTMPGKKKDPLLSSMGSIGSAVGGIAGSFFGGPAGGMAGSKVGGALGETLGDQGEGPGAVDAGPLVDAAKRRMDKQNAPETLRNANDRIMSSNDPQLQQTAGPIIQEALRRSDEEQRRQQSLRRDQQNGL